MKTTFASLCLFLALAAAGYSAETSTLLTPAEQTAVNEAAAKSDAALNMVATRAQAGTAALVENVALKAQVATLQQQLLAAQVALAKSQADLAAANKKLADIKAAGGF